MTPRVRIALKLTLALVGVIVALLAAEARPQDTLLFMSNGGFGGIYDKMEAALRARGG